MCLSGGFLGGAFGSPASYYCGEIVIVWLRSINTNTNRALGSETTSFRSPAGTSKSCENQKMISDLLTTASAFCVFALVWVIYYASLRYQEHCLIKRLGGYAPVVYGRLPFGRLMPCIPSFFVSTDDCPGIDM